MLNKINNLIKSNKTVFENFTYLTLIQVVNLVVPFLIYPYLISVIGGENFGKVVYAQVVMIIISSFVNYGFNTIGVKRIAEERKLKERKMERRKMYVLSSAKCVNRFQLPSWAIRRKTTVQSGMREFFWLERYQSASEHFKAFLI